jgi:hypothetical protein
MARQNLGAALHVGVLIPNESPKMCEGDDFMPQRPIDIADSGLIRFQIKNDDLLETIRHASVLDQFRRRHPLPPAVAGRASLRRSRKHAERAERSIERVGPLRPANRQQLQIVILYMVEAVITAYQ